MATKRKRHKPTKRIPALQVDVDAKAIRDVCGMSQPEFARAFGFNLSTLRQWEQGRRGPCGTARVLLLVIEASPRIVTRLVREAGGSLT
jgi:putative transcriptional regulator